MGCHYGIFLEFQNVLLVTQQHYSLWKMGMALNYQDTNSRVAEARATCYGALETYSQRDGWVDHTGQNGPLGAVTKSLCRDAGLAELLR